MYLTGPESTFCPLFFFFVKKIQSTLKKQKQGFPNILNLRNIRNLFYSKFSKNYEKMMSKSNFYFHEKLIATQIPTQIFEFEYAGS